MNHRIYPQPFTRLNEHWLVNCPIFDGKSSSPYADTLVVNKANHFHADIMDLQAEWQQTAGIDIVAETVFDYPYSQITEKILRPILSKRMFILVGSPKTLEQLHLKGFKTFPSFIDEDYDNITDPILRITHLTNEIKRICDMTIEEIQEAVIMHEDTLVHNLNLLHTLEAVELNALRRKLQKI
jgi:hypothetical protein